MQLANGKYIFELKLHIVSNKVFINCDLMYYIIFKFAVCWQLCSVIRGVLGEVYVGICRMPTSDVF